MGKRKTPLIQRLRDQSGTIYIFPSASEDINLNLNNTSNGVALSHYALLNIPTLKRSSLLMDYVESVEHPIKQGDGNSLMQVSLQNYMMNLETMILNDPNYNFQDFNTVTERVFWKWFTKITNTRFTKITTSTGKEYYKHNAVSCFGKIDAENHLSTEFSMFNETYINIPTSYGGGPVYFREKTDNLLSDGVKFTDNTKDALEGRDDTNTLNISYTNFNDKPFFDNQDDGSYTFSSFDGDLMEIVKSVTNINEAINTELGKNVQVNNFDDINVDVAQQLTTDTVNLVKDEFKFNAILLYYTVYDKNDTVKHAEAINLFGIIFLDGLKPVTNVSATEQYLIQPFVKRKSTATNFGNSFSFRVNMKTLSIYDNTDAIIQDNTTMSSVNSVDFSDVISQLNKAVSIMNANAKTTEVIQDEYAKIKTTYNDQAEKITNLYHQLDAYINGNKSQTLYVSSLTADNVYNTIPFGDKDTLQEFLDINLYNYPDLVKVSNDDELYLNPDCELFNKTENSTGIFEYLHGYDNDGNSLLNYVELIPYLLLKFQHLEQTEATTHIELTDIVCETLQVNKSANVEMLSIVSDLNVGQEDIRVQLNNKQDKLTAGNGIIINENVISVRDENNSIKQGNNNLTSSFNLIGKDTKSKLKVDDEHANLSGLVYHVVSGTDPVQYDKVVQYSFATDKILFQNYQTNAQGALQTLNTEYKQDAKNITLTGEKIILNPSSAFEVSNCSVKMNLGTDNSANINTKQLNIETNTGVVVKNEYDTKIFELKTSSNETKINTRVDISVPADDRDNNTLSIRKDAYEVVVNSTTGVKNWQKMSSGGNPFAFGIENNGTKTTYFNTLPDGRIYVYGVGGYVGTSTSGCQTLQDTIAAGGGGGDLSNYYTKAECNLNFAAINHTHSYNDLNDKPSIPTGLSLTTAGSGNVISDVSVNGFQITVTKSTAGSALTPGNKNNIQIQNNTIDALGYVYDPTTSTVLVGSTYIDPVLNDKFVVGSGYGNTKMNSFRVQASGGSSYVYINESYDSPTNRTHIFGDLQVSQNITITKNATAAAFYQSSDERLKNIKSELCLDDCYKLMNDCSTIVYSLKDDENDQNQIGMIAQQVKEIMPEVVQENNGYYSINYSRLSVVALRLIKNLSERIIELEKDHVKLAELMKRVEKLENNND